MKLLEGTYPVTAGAATCGSAQVQRQGLYYLIHCQCRPEGEAPFRLCVVWTDRQCDLGLCVKEDAGFGLRCRIPIKAAGQGTPFFSIQANVQASSGAIYPLKERVHFPYLALVRDSVLINCGSGLAIKVQSQGPQDSGQNP